MAKQLGGWGGLPESPWPRAVEKASVVSTESRQTCSKRCCDADKWHSSTLWWRLSHLESIAFRFFSSLVMVKSRTPHTWVLCDFSRLWWWRRIRKRLSPRGCVHTCVYAWMHTLHGMFCVKYSFRHFLSSDLSVSKQFPGLNLSLNAFFPRLMTNTRAHWHKHTNRCDKSWARFHAFLWANPLPGQLEIGMIFCFLGYQTSVSNHCYWEIWILIIWVEIIVACSPGKRGVLSV
jgi:hypothetical protein